MSIPPPGLHGGDAAAIAHALGVDVASMIDLSASMNPVAPSMVAVVRALLDRDPSLVTAYPDCHTAEHIVAGLLDEPQELVVLTNGAAEAIALVAAEVQRASIVEPEFSLYERHLPVVDHEAMRWRSNPSNPLGQLAEPCEEAGVWDEAFYPLATGAWSRGDRGSWRIGSLTKLWSCPGLRLGYLIAPDADAARRVRERQPCWSVNGLAAAAVAPMAEQTDLPSWNRAIAEIRGDLCDALASLGYPVSNTDANWILVDAPGLRDRLAYERIVVRDCTSFGLLGTVRVALPSSSSLERVVKAFARCAP